MASKFNTERKTKIFISYSRKDKLFVRKLNAAIDTAQIDAWVDWEGIPLSSDWMKEITTAIEAGDAFVFVISPDSLKSPVCAEELELGIKNNKKIIPVLYRDPEKRQKMHRKLSSTNWVYLRPKKDDFKATIPKLVDAIRTDLGWVQQHTRLLQRAIEWDQKKRNSSFLLHGSDIEDGEHWLTESTEGQGRAVVPLQAEYINTSRKVAVEKQRNLMIGVALAMIISIVLGVFAIFQWRNADANALLASNNAATAVANGHVAATQQAIAVEKSELALQNENKAKARRSAAQATIYMDRPGELSTSTLLAVDSWLRLPSADAEDILRHNVSEMPVPVAQMRHSGRIWNIHASADGEFLVSSSADKTACVWTLRGEKKYCVTHSGDVYDALLTSDNRLLITASADGTIGLWDGSSGAAVDSLALGPIIWDIDLHPDNVLLAVARDDGKVSMIDLETRQEVFYFDFDSGPVFSVEFDSNGKLLGVGTSAGDTRIWRVNTGLSFSGPEHAADVYKIVFSPDGSWMVSVGEDSTARAAKTTGGGQAYSLKHGDWVEDAAFSPDSSWFVTASDDNLVRVWDTRTGIEQMRMAHAGFVQRVEVSPNGQWILSASFDHTARVWDAYSGALMFEISIEGSGMAVTFNPDGNSVIVGDSDGRISIWDISSLDSRIGYVAFPEFVHKAKFSSGGEWILFNTDGKDLWQIPTSELTVMHDGSLGKKILSLPNITSQLKVSADSKWIVISETYASRATVYNLESQVKYPLPHDSDISGLTFSADSQFLATTNKDGRNVYIWEVSSGQPLETIPFDEVAFTAAYSPATSTALAIGLTDRILLWDIPNGRAIADLSQVGKIISLTFNQDGSWLATTSADGSIYVWDMKNANYAEPVYRFLQGGSITSLDFSSNHRWLASGGENGFAYLWDLTSGEEVSRLPHSNSVTSVSFSPDSGQLVTVSRKLVQVWDVSRLVPIKTDDILVTACSRLIQNFSPSTWQFFFQEEEYRPLCSNLP